MQRHFAPACGTLISRFYYALCILILITRVEISINLSTIAKITQQLFRDTFTYILYTCFEAFLEFLREVTRVNRRGCRKSCSLIIYQLTMPSTSIVAQPHCHYVAACCNCYAIACRWNSKWTAIDCLKVRSLRNYA